MRGADPYGKGADAESCRLDSLCVILTEILNNQKVSRCKYNHFFSSN